MVNELKVKYVKYNIIFIALIYFIIIIIIENIKINTHLNFNAKDKVCHNYNFYPIIWFSRDLIKYKQNYNFTKIIFYLTFIIFLRI